METIRNVIPLLGGVLVLVLGMQWLLKNWRWREVLRPKHPGAEGKPYCCELDCVKDAEFGIYGSSGHFEDVTEACEEHVGALLGTPTWLANENDHWVIHPISASVMSTGA